MTRDVDWFPIDRWLTDMKSAVEKINEQGDAMLHEHRRESETAARNADLWHLSDRHSHSRETLLSLVVAVREIIESIDECRHLIMQHPGDERDVQRSISHCSAVIDGNLPAIEKSFVEIRHCALDLLQWTQRSARMEKSQLPETYRASFAGLIKYTPIFKPMMAAFQHDLLRINQSPGIHPETQRLVSLVNRYNAVAESARGFIGSVVEPPLELVFHETEMFAADVESLSSEQMGMVATEVNDCCQLLLYDPVEFKRRVHHVRPQLTEGIDASLVVLTISDAYKLIFTADEDPLFRQLVITLFRVVPVAQLDPATIELTRALYASFSSEQ